MLTGYFTHFFIITTGVAFMWVLLDVRPRQIALWRRYAGFVLLGLIYLATMLALNLFGEITLRKLYPFLIHLPILLCFSFLCQTQFKKVVFSFVTTLSMMSTPIVVMRVLGKLLSLGTLPRMLILIAINLLLLYVLWRWATPPLHFVFEHQYKTWWLFLCIPVVYWITGYLRTQYNPSKSDALGDLVQTYATWVIVQLSYLLIFNLFSQLQKLHSQEEEARWMALQMSRASHTIEQMEAANKQSSIYRHDLRHHADVLDGYLQMGSVEQAQEYLHSLRSDLALIHPETVWCAHNAANLLLCAYVARTSGTGLRFEVQAHISAQLSIEDKDLGVVLGNGLENAFSAALQVPVESKPCVLLTAQMQEEKLLLEIKNSCAAPVAFQNGLPVTHKNGHGFGTKSIQTIVRKYGGICSFLMEDGLFVVRVML